MVMAKICITLSDYKYTFLIHSKSTELTQYFCGVWCKNVQIHTLVLKRIQFVMIYSLISGNEVIVYLFPVVKHAIKRFFCEHLHLRTIDVP